LCLTISGILAANYGWECTFYVWGTCGVVWSMFWFFLVYDTPNDHPRISDDEKTFVNSNVHKAYDLGKLPPAPILKILTSGPVLANIFTALGQNYGFYTILKMTPTYLNNIQHISIRNVSAYQH
jgi:sugar phosphate permease